MLIDCEHAAEICNKAQYGEAGSWQIVQLKIHHIYCGQCRNHASKNGKLTQLCTKADLKCMDPEKKKKIKEKLESQT
ncbi:hypothetical protein [Robertkochia flava]|uniref:hypothetical protein n=1 Tax=Robertkochia flava TaxID=3447986 RepID=UPI001CC9CB15|nr:hypothetical protein [Robertkochia marina]